MFYIFSNFSVIIWRVLSKILDLSSVFLKKKVCFISCFKDELYFRLLKCYFGFKTYSWVILLSLQMRKLKLKVVDAFQKLYRLSGRTAEI